MKQRNEKRNRKSEMKRKTYKTERQKETQTQKNIYGNRKRDIETGADKVHQKQKQWKL